MSDSESDGVGDGNYYEDEQASKKSDIESGGHSDNGEDMEGDGAGSEEKSQREEENRDEDDEFRDMYADEDGVSFMDHQVNEAIQRRREEKERQRAAGDLAFVDNVDERLGDDFEDTPWVAPTLEVAWEYRLAKLYRGGKAKLSKLHITKATDIGLGVPLYFIFVKTVGLAALLMSVLSVPALLFSYVGHNISDEDRDAFGLYKLSIGNIGHNRLSNQYEERSLCSDREDMECFTVLGIEFSLLEIANIIALCEFLQVLVCLIAFIRLVRTHSRMKHGSDNRTCSITDYSIMVENIPPDTTMEDLIQHFSDLYPLDRPDWKGRPGVEGAEPLKHSTNSGYSAHKGTWVAEATIFTKIGSMIRSFKDKQKLMDNLLRCRARMKMYKDDTCHAHGPNPSKFKKAESDMMSTGMAIDKLTMRSVKAAKRDLAQKKASKYSAKLQENASRLPGGIPAESLVGFVVFNYAESMARCIEDYKHYNSYPFKLFMPKKMLLKGYHIKVVRGPEPDEVMWENLEVPKSKKYGSRAFSACVAFCLILLGFAFILQAAQYKAKFDDDVPNLAFCDSEIPALYAKSYDFPSNAELVRPDRRKDDEGFTRSNYDLSCSTVDSGSFYAIYAEDGNFNRPLTNYSVSACVASDCPLADSALSCPCITTTSKENCDTLSCSIPGDAHCTKFKAGTVGGCYCYEELLSLFSSSFLGLVFNLLDQDEACAEFFTNYSIAMGLSIAASLCTVAINVFLKKTMKYLARREYHETVDEEQSATIVKVFVATYCNMAFVALAAYGYWNTKPGIMNTAQVFDGDYADFTPQWYAVVGSYLVTTFILQIFGPLGMGLLKYYIIYPCKMCRAHPKISQQASHKYAMQADVNALELGGTFDTTVSNAQLLSLFFFAMTYAPGLPIMMPLMLFAFVLYFRVDKMLLLRFYERPPKMGDAVMRVVLALMPWAMVIRLGVACWMYSNSDIFPYYRLKLNAIPKLSVLNTHHIDKMYNNWVINHVGKDVMFFNTGTRIMRGTVFPLFCLLAIIAVSTILFKIMRHSPLYYFFKVLKWFRAHLKLSNLKQGPAQKIYAFEIANRRDPLRAEMAPFTGEYFQFLNSEFEKSRKLARCLGFLKKFVAPDLTEEELQQGWRVSYNGPYKVKMCQWLKTTRVAGVGRPAGSVQRTYEMISCHGCWSYQLQRIPLYKKIMIAIKDGMDSIAHDLEMEALGDKASGEIANRMSILASYEKRHLDKEAAVVEKQKEKQAVWKNPGPAAKQNKVLPVITDADVFDAIERGEESFPNQVQPKQLGEHDDSSSEDSDD